MHPIFKGTVWAGLLGLGGFGVLGVTPARAADTPPGGGVAVGTANASGVRTSYDFPGFLVVDQFYDVGGPVANANVNSSGAGTAFASFPYPGDTIVNAPALANVGTGQAFPFTYPLYVVTDGNLTPKASAQDASGTIVLNAESGPRSAVSGAKAAGPTAGVIVTSGSLQNATVTIGADGTMTSTADSVTRGIDVGVLKIAEVHVHTVSLLHPGDSKPTTTSLTDVTGVTVLGQNVGLDKNGITAAGNSGGTSDKDGLAALNKALASSGVTVSLANSDSTSGGDSSAGVQILQRGKLPFNGSPVGVARTLIGNASSSIVGSSTSLTPEVGSTGSGTVAGAAGSATTPDTTPAAATPATLPALPSDAVSPIVPVAGSPTLPAGSASSTASQPPTVNLQPLASGTEPTALETLDVHPQLEFFYLAFAVGAGVLVLTSVARRVKGGRS